MQNFVADTLKETKVLVRKHLPSPEFIYLFSWKQKRNRVTKKPKGTVYLISQDEVRYKS